MDPKRYVLPVNLSHSIFRDFILPSELPWGNRASATEPPRAAITGGQPGAGKSALIERLRKRSTQTVESTGVDGTKAWLFGKPWTVVSGDDLRRYHPEFERLLREDPHNAAFYTDRDAGRWTEMLIEEASNRQLDLVIESTMRQPDTVRKTSSLLRAKGYAIEAHVVAVRPSLSWLGVHLRYEEAIRIAGHGRFTIRASHDAAVAGLPVTLAVIQDETLATSISIWERGAARTTFESHFRDGAWSSNQRPEDWLKSYWSQPATPADIQDIARGWALVFELMRSRDASASEIAAARC